MSAIAADMQITLPGGYALRRLLDQGSFAAVYEAVAPDGTPVAVKLLTSDHAQAEKRFQREIKVMRALPRSPLVVRYLDHGATDDGIPFIVMELIGGSTLAARLDDGRKYSESAACALMMTICKAFAGLHRLGLTHGDIKPANIMISRGQAARTPRGRKARDGSVLIAEVEGAAIKLIDFGLVRDAQGLLKLLEEENMMAGHDFQAELDAGVVMGTPEYIAPEQVTDARTDDARSWRTDTPADVFGLGVIFYQLLAGAPPWPFNPSVTSGPEYRRQVVDYLDERATRLGAPERIDAVSPALWSVLCRALHPDPKKRPGDAKQLFEDIERYVLCGVGVPGDLDNEETIMAYLPDLVPSRRDEAEPEDDEDEAPAASPAPSRRSRQVYVWGGIAAAAATVAAFLIAH